MREAVVKKIKFMIGKSGRKIKDLTGQTFGELRVRSLAKERNRRGKPQWVCKCSCGETCVVTGQYLISGHKKSCGCLNKLKIGKVHC